MTRFSERIGVRAPRLEVQADSMDDALRNSLWNVLYELAFSPTVSDRAHRMWGEVIWQYFLKLPVDTLSDYRDKATYQIRTWFYEGTWLDVYDLVDFVAGGSGHDADELRKRFNVVLNRERSAYRFVGEQLVPITDSVEIDAVESALDAASHVAGARKHLRTALALFGDRQNPDYRNAAKEAISAVESLVLKIAGREKAPFAEVVGELKDHGLTVHGALLSAWKSLYGYASDEAGIRHGMTKDSPVTVTAAEAKYMIVSCSAIVSYLLELCAQQRISLQG